MVSTSSALRLPSFSPLPELQLTLYLPGNIAATCNSFAPRLNFSEPPPHEASDYTGKKLSVDACGLWQRGNGVAKCVVRRVSVRRRGAAAGSPLWD